MKMLTKLALVSAIAMSSSAMAMQALDDETLSASTGQDGITLQIDTTGISIENLYLHDNDGFDNTALGGTTTAGAITLNGVRINKVNAGDKLATAKIDADAGAGGTTPFLNIGVSLASTKIEVDEIGVAASNAAPTISATTTARRGVTNEVNIITDLGLTLGATDMNIQLGNQPQGALIVVDATILGGLNISGLTINDTEGGGSIIVGDTWVKDANSANMSAASDISVTPDGLSITGAGTAKDIYVSSIQLGALASPSIGSLEVNGLDVGTTSLFVTGH